MVETINGATITIGIPVEPGLEKKKPHWITRIIDMLQRMRGEIDDIVFASSNPNTLKHIREKMKWIQTIRTHPYYPSHSNNRIHDIIEAREQIRRYFCDHTNNDILVMIDSDVWCPTNIIRDIINKTITQCDYVRAYPIGAIISMKRKTACSITYTSNVYYCSRNKCKGEEKLVKQEDIYLEEHWLAEKQIEYINYWCRMRLDKHQCINTCRHDATPCMHRDCPPGTYRCW